MTDATTQSTVPALRYTRLRPDAWTPGRQHVGDAGIDLYACERVQLSDALGSRCDVGTGVAVEIPYGWVGLLCPRSGLAAKHGIGLTNAPGVIDSGYRGEVRVLLQSYGAGSELTIEPGDRIAQLVLVPVFTGTVEEVDALDEGDRGVHGFGSTGGFS